MSTILYLSNQLVQAVEVKGQKTHLVCQEMAPAGSLINGIITDEEVFIEWVKQFFLKNKLSRKECTLVINSTQINTRVLELPRTRRAEILKMISREFSDIRTPQTIFTYQMLTGDFRDKLQRILAVAVEREFLVSYLRLFAQADIEITVIEPAITNFIRRFSDAQELQKDNCIVQVKDGQEIISLLFVKGVYVYSQRNRVFNDSDMSAFAREAEAVVGRLQQFAASQHIENPIGMLFICGENQKDLKEILEHSTGLSQQLKIRFFNEERSRNKKKAGVDFIYPSTVNAGENRKINLARYIKQDSIELEKRREQAMLAVPAGITLLICLIITVALCISWIRNVSDISRYQKAIEDPETVSAHTAYELADASVTVMGQKIEKAEIFWQYLMSYPTINSSIINTLRECTGDGVTLNVDSFNRDSGVISLSVSAKDAGKISDFISGLQELDMIKAVEYSGYTLDKEKNCYSIHVVCALSAGAGR